MISVINYFSALLWLYGGIISNEAHRSDRSCPMRARSNQQVVSERLFVSDTHLIPQQVVSELDVMIN